MSKIRVSNKDRVEDDVIAISQVVSLTNKAILRYTRLGYPSLQRIVDAPRHNVITCVNLPSTIQISDFPISAIDVAKLSKSKAQPNRDLRDRKNSTKPYEMLLIDFKFMLLIHNTPIDCL